jgi:hypothetical protein
VPYLSSEAFSFGLNSLVWALFLEGVQSPLQPPLDDVSLHLNFASPELQREQVTAWRLLNSADWQVTDVVQLNSEDGDLQVGYDGSPDVV